MDLGVHTLQDDPISLNHIINQINSYSVCPMQMSKSLRSALQTNLDHRFIVFANDHQCFVPSLCVCVSFS